MDTSNGYNSFTVDNKARTMEVIDFPGRHFS